VLLGGRQQLAGAGADLLAAAADLADELAQVADGVVEGGGQRLQVALVGAAVGHHGQVAVGGRRQHGGQLLDPALSRPALVAGLAAQVPDRRRQGRS
jgi:hypothetical protein